MPRVPRTAPLGLSTLAVCALLTACAPRSIPHPSGPAGTVVIVTRLASASSPAGADHHLDVSVSCRPGEQLLAGGYAAVAVFESDYTLLSIYPATDTTWRVAANSGSSYQLQALAYCLASSPSLGIRALQASACPRGTVHLTGGFKGFDPDRAGTGMPYVLCASRGVTPTARGIRVGHIELDCASHATGDEQSESRTFSFTCATTRAAGMSMRSPG
jgi:hypothetical protein